MTFEILANEGLSARYESMAARVGPKINELRKQYIRESFCTIHQVEHRLEHVAMVQGKEFINDSISVTVNSTWWAMESNNKPIVWIVGGIENGKDYQSLGSLVSQKVKAIVCLCASVVKGFLIYECYRKHRQRGRDHRAASPDLWRADGAVAAGSLYSAGCYGGHARCL